MYDKLSAINYATFWWNKRNPNFYNFDSIGGDCTNFISQCLLAGKIIMNTTKSNGWYFYSLTNRTPSWTGVEEFFNFSVNNKTDFGPKTKIVTISEVEVGDIVQLLQKGTRFNHNLIITKIDGVNNLTKIKVTCHTNDALNKPLADYYFKKIRFLKILN